MSLFLQIDMIGKMEKRLYKKLISMVFILVVMAIALSVINAQASGGDGNGIETETQECVGDQCKVNVGQEPVKFDIGKDWTIQAESTEKDTTADVDIKNNNDGSSTVTTENFDGVGSVKIKVGEGADEREYNIGESASAGHDKPGEITFCVLARTETNEANRLVVTSIGCAIPAENHNYGYLSEHHGFGETEGKTGNYAEDLAASMLATTLGIEFDADKDWNEKEEVFKMSGKIVRTRNITQSAIGKDGVWTTVIAAAVFLPD